MTADDTVAERLAQWEALAEGATERAEVAEQARAEAERRFQDRDAGAERSLHHWFIEGALWASAAAPTITTALLGFVREVRAECERLDRVDGDPSSPTPSYYVSVGRQVAARRIEQAARKWIGGEGDESSV